ncbi:MAG: sigma-70 family RNA polymerase sigma factor [Oscillibacter sp.]|nr:sigma-70 family RNA polymerase sigma factor [Oscillibacter sp.]
MIDGMALGHGDGMGGSGKGRISNKTMYIALNYQEKMDRMNAEAANEIAQRLLELEGEQDRLRYYVSLLEKREMEALRLFYFEGRSWEETAKELGVVLRSVYKIKSKAIGHLADLYAYKTGLN